MLLQLSMVTTNLENEHPPLSAQRGAGRTWTWLMMSDCTCTSNGKCPHRDTNGLLMYVNRAGCEGLVDTAWIHRIRPTSTAPMTIIRNQVASIDFSSG